MNRLFGPGHYAVLGLIGLSVLLSVFFGTNSLANLAGPFTLRVGLLIWMLPASLWIGMIVLKLLNRKAESPSKILLRKMRKRRFWLIRGSLFTLLVLVAGTAFTNLKVQIPKTVPFYADSFLTAWDQKIFGTDAWRLTHSVFGPEGTVFIDRMYIAWFFMVSTLITWLCFSRDEKFQIKGLIVYVFTWLILGVFFATTLSSVGPLFVREYYGAGHFDPLVASLTATHKTHQLTLFTARDYLLQTFGTNEPGAGISAMPSLHVAMAFLFYLMCREGLTVRWPSWCAAAYAAIIMVGSVHLGWHYATDGIVSIIGIAAIWWAVGRVMDWAERRSAARAAALPEGALALPAI